MRRSTTVYALMLAGTLAVPAVSYSQASSPDADQSIATDADRDNDNWGWLGLLGLAGLLGLKRRDRETQPEHLRGRQPL